MRRSGTRRRTGRQARRVSLLSCMAAKDLAGGERCTLIPPPPAQVLRRHAFCFVGPRLRLRMTIGFADPSSDRQIYRYRIVHHQSRTRLPSLLDRLPSIPYLSTVDPIPGCRGSHTRLPSILDPIAVDPGPGCRRSQSRLPSIPYPTAVDSRPGCRRSQSRLPSIPYPAAVNPRPDCRQSQTRLPSIPEPAAVNPRALSHQRQPAGLASTATVPPAPFAALTVRAVLYHCRHAPPPPLLRPSGPFPRL